MEEIKEKLHRSRHK